MLRLSLLLLILPFSANAGWPFESSPYVFFGADYDVSKKKTCYSGSDSSNMGIGQTLYKKGLVEINAQWTHHSCISDYNDKNVYDGLGVHARIHFW